MPLGVAHPRNRLEQNVLLAAIHRKKLLDVSWLNDGYSQDLHSLFAQRQLRVASPNHHFRLHQPVREVWTSQASSLPLAE